MPDVRKIKRTMVAGLERKLVPLGSVWYYLMAGVMTHPHKENLPLNRFALSELGGMQPGANAPVGTIQIKISEQDIRRMMPPDANILLKIQAIAEVLERIIIDQHLQVALFQALRGMGYEMTSKGKPSIIKVKEQNL